MVIVPLPPDVQYYQNVARTSQSVFRIRVCQPYTELREREGEEEEKNKNGEELPPPPISLPLFQSSSLAVANLNTTAELHLDRTGKGYHSSFSTINYSVLSHHFRR
uniref:Uncharacterized protein n=1 Tax=Nelumbo nucifera TaxID=4432 RepID=A0A822XIS1_NELNU|nr:TPA_asm: hypothetical protein HUJ06_021365 [Nelumbo nucifera]